MYLVHNHNCIPKSDKLLQRVQKTVVTSSEVKRFLDDDKTGFLEKLAAVNLKPSVIISILEGQHFDNRKLNPEANKHVRYVVYHFPAGEISMTFITLL